MMLHGDNMVEQDEFFILTLEFHERTNTNVRLLPNEVDVIIQDNDGNLVYILHQKKTLLMIIILLQLLQ